CRWRWPPRLRKRLSRRLAWRSPATPCCCRRLAPAWTCSATTSTAPRSLSVLSRNWRSNGGRCEMSLFGELTSGVNAVRPSRTQMRNYDLPLIASASCLLLLGLVMVYSASVALPDSPKFSRYDNHHFLIRHAIYIVLGLVASIAVFSVRMSVWNKWAMHIFGVALILL